MRIILIIALLASSCHAGEIVGIFQPTGRYAQKTVTKTRKPDYLAMFTAKYCGPCQTWKRTEKTKLKSRGIEVVEIEMTDPNNAGLVFDGMRFPAFWIIDGETGAWSDGPFIGVMSAETLETKIKSKRNGKTVQKTRATTQSGYAASSCNCSSACTCGCQSGGVCNCRSSQSFQQLFQAPQQVHQTRGVEYGGAVYTGRVCSNPNCKMCNQIQRGLERQSIQYQPMSIKVDPAQEGTPHESTGMLLDAMELNQRDVLADLGCGDARILIAAARRWGLHCIGIEIDPVVAERARQAVRAAGLGHLITIETGDARDFDVSRCSAVVAYLYPELLDELAPKMRSVRVAASVFHEVDGFEQVGDCWIHRNE